MHESFRNDYPLFDVESSKSQFRQRVQVVIRMNNEEFKTDTEKRMDERSDCKGIIKWSYFNQSNYFDGELLNISQKGFYFETSESI